ncbi:HD family phosphohydrolase [Gilvibacter sp.]|uniref:HD family phosphohydrolase n=1 Tax=Gilvibacter sp. TaxID=2729997 RepID=UPI003B52C33B
MAKFKFNFYRNQSLLYKAVLFIAATVLIIYFFPKGGKFKYDYQKGQVWQDENLYAPFDFAIKKDAEALAAEQEEIRNNITPYFDLDAGVAERVKANFANSLTTNYVDSLSSYPQSVLSNYGLSLIDKVYDPGVLGETMPYAADKMVFLREGNQGSRVAFGSLQVLGDINTNLTQQINASVYAADANLLQQALIGIFEPNVSYNKRFTETTLEEALAGISPTKGIVEADRRIIARGEVVEGEKYQILESLRMEYESQVWSKSNYNWIVFGYALLVSLALMMLLLFLRKYRQEIFANNTKVTFIFFNIVLMVLLTTLVVKYDPKYVYVVPLCVLPLILKAFFDPRLGLFVHVLTVLLLGFIVPNSFEYMFLQIIAGIVTILTVSELYKRANLFISVGQITIIYMLGYFAFNVIHEGGISGLDELTFGYFILAGLATLLSYPLIYFYEKIFGLVSDVSLLELSDTNSKLLKELSDKAPGTFHHSLNVANLAEAAANEIGANAMLIRVGALYHDIGKMANPTYFTENQATAVNSHDDLEPAESARIIIDHVIKGIEIAKKNNLPDRVIDFIRTHHGTSLVYYFYKKQQEKEGEEIDAAPFRYPGPIPFSKETAILMMADSVEAASKSLKEPTYTKIEAFVENIVSKQMEQGQFLNANITFKEIQTVKKVLKKKLSNIYHLRVEYPE